MDIRVCCPFRPRENREINNDSTEDGEENDLEKDVVEKDSNPEGGCKKGSFQKSSFQKSLGQEKDGEQRPLKKDGGKENARQEEGFGKEDDGKENTRQEKGFGKEDDCQKNGDQEDRRQEKADVIPFHRGCSGVGRSQTRGGSFDYVESDFRKHEGPDSQINRLSRCSGWNREAGRTSARSVQFSWTNFPEIE
jgi:hypothetical protein